MKLKKILEDAHYRYYDKPDVVIEPADVVTLYPEAKLRAITNYGTKDNLIPKQDWENYKQWIIDYIHPGGQLLTISPVEKEDDSILKAIINIQDVRFYSK
jgi:hypothetical protein